MQRRARRPFQRARLRYDSTFALEVEYCFDRGIPYEEYLARWSAEDRAKVAAVALERGEKCTRCGTREWEWHEDPNAYEPIYWTCMGCQKRELLEKSDEKTAPGTSIRLVPRQTAAKMRERAAQGIARPQRRRVAGQR